MEQRQQPWNLTPGQALEALDTPPERGLSQVEAALRTNQVDLVLISSRARSGFSRWLMGSVADRVVRGATVPVLLVRGRERKDRGLVGASL